MGDVNGDGYYDVLVGTHVQERVNIYLGGPAPSTTSVMHSLGAAGEGELFGLSIGRMP